MTTPSSLTPSDFQIQYYTIQNNHMTLNLYIQWIPMVRDNLPKQFGEPTCDIKANIHKYNIASVPRHTTPLGTLLPRK